MTRATLRVHAVWPRSRANGPGVRAVVWTQGCSLGCPGCFNPETHAPDGGVARAVDDLLREIADGAPVGGLTVSGGEPFQQPDGLLALVRGARARGLSVLVFSGYARAEIDALPHGPAILAHVDLLVAGRYVASERVAAGLLGSANQRVHLLTDRHTEAELLRAPTAELRVRADGTLEFSGIDPVSRPRRPRPTSA